MLRCKEVRRKALCVLRGNRGRWKRRVRSCLKREAPCACCGAMRIEGSRSGMCGIACATTPFLRNDRESQQAVSACALAGALVLAACEDMRADGDAAEDGDID